MLKKGTYFLLLLLMAIGISGCLAYYPVPSGPKPVKPVYRCVAIDSNHHKFLWVSGSQSVCINRALFRCNYEGHGDCQIIECKTKLVMKAY